MAGKGGGAWKVAYADFVTAMMAFFLVMWITAQSKPVKQAVAQYFNDPMKTSMKPSGDAAGGATLLPSKKPDASPSSPSTKIGGTSLLERPRPGPRPGGRGAAIDPERATTDKKKVVVIEKPTLLALRDGDQRSVGTMVQFGGESAELDDAGRQRLKRLVPDLLGKPYRVEIRGHTMRRPLSPQCPFADAWALCYARCLAVMKYLEQLGVEPERIRLSQGGPFEPHAVGVDPAAQASNSRVDVNMLGEIAEELVGPPGASRQSPPARATAPLHSRASH